MPHKAKEKLHRQALMILLAFSMVPLMALFVTTYVMMDRVLRDKVDAVMEQSVSNLALVLSGHLQSLVDMTLFSARNGDLAAVLNRVPDSRNTRTGYFDVERIMKEREILARIPSPYQYMAIAKRDGPAYGSIRAYPKMMDAPFADSSFVLRILDRLSASYTQEVLLANAENIVLEMGPQQMYAAANILSNGENTGVLMMGIDLRFFIRLLDHARMNEDVSLFILDSRGNALVSGARNPLDIKQLPSTFGTLEGKMQTSGTFILRGRSYRTLRVPLRMKGINPDLALLLATPKDSLYAEKGRFVRITISLALISLIGIALMAMVLQRSLIRPILALHRKVAAVRTGNLDTSIGQLPANELGQLGEGLDLMTSDLKRYIEEIRKREASRREMEIGLLQSQIKPHFVRNTLNTIRWMADMKGAEGIGRAIHSLSLLMEYNFRNSDLLVKVRDELAYTREYVYMQRIRYQNKFEWVESVPDALLDCLILRLSFQPIVENAITHGLSRKKEGGCLTLDGRRSGAQLIFTIHDDGVGMSPSALNEVREQRPCPSDESCGERIALSNIRQRLRMQYGIAADLVLESTEGVGTTVQLIFPAEYAEDAEVAEEEVPHENPAG